MLYYRIPAGLDGRAVVSAGSYCGKVSCTRLKSAPAMVSARQGLSLSQSHSVALLPILALEWRCTHDILYPVLFLVFLCAV